MKTEIVFQAFLKDQEIELLRLGRASFYAAMGLTPTGLTQGWRPRAG